MRDREHGRLIAPDRPGELARAIRVLLDHPEHRTKMGATAQRHVEQHFTWAQSTQALSNLYTAHGLEPDWIPAMPEAVR
jgi:glycosyltransferase involved in cell wall biosynthesis